MARVRTSAQALAVAALLLLRAGPARAHAVNVATAEVAVRERAVEIELSVNLFELDLLLGLDRDRSGAVEQAELEAARDRITEYLSRHVEVDCGGVALPLELHRLGVGRSGDSRSVALLGLRFARAGGRGDLRIRCDPLSDLGPDHRTLAVISRGAGAEPFVFRSGVEYRVAGAAVESHVTQFLALGVLHIFTGYDHVLFLVGLLLAVRGLLEVLKVVTSFTVAHSLTMSLAVLGQLQPPSRWIETGIAASIAYVAVENLLRRAPRRRWLVSLGFGLVHGFGFATVLLDMSLPRADMAVSLLAFNGGVEMGQLAIVLVVFPLVRLLWRTAAYARVVSTTSALLLAVGLFWIWQRAL